MDDLSAILPARRNGRSPPLHDGTVTAAFIAYGFLGSFLGAAFLLQWVEVGLGLGLGLGAAGVACACSTKTRRGSPALVGMAAAVLAVARVMAPAASSDIVWVADGREVVLEGVVVDLPDNRGDVMGYLIDVRAIAEADGPASPATGRATATVRQLWPRAAYGDRVRLRGKAEPRPDDGYGDYLDMRGIGAVVKSSGLEILKSGEGNPATGILFAIRTTIEARINRLLGEPQSSLLAGILLGARRGMPQELDDAFRTTGLSHIVAVSGTNVTIIITVLSALLSFLPRGARLLATSILIIAFTVLAGATASAVRAAIMGILGLLALQAGRKQEARLMILWTAFLMTAWNPKQLWWDAGFQLSFLAIIGLLEIGPFLKARLARVPDVLGLREALLATLAAQIGAVPWGTFRFGNLPLLSPVSNLLVAPLIAPAMFLGAVCTVLGFVWLPLGQVTAFGAWICLSLIIAIARVSAKVPYAAVALEELSPWIITAYYAGLAAVVLWLQRHPQTPATVQ